MHVPGPIVLIDDDADDQELFKYVLSKIDVVSELRLFSNGPDALHYLSVTTECPFVIICDINMPVMNGLEFRRLINADERLRKKSVPFIFLTTTAMPHQVELAYELTVQGFFEKPDSIKEMEETFRQMLDYWRKCIHPNMLRS